MAIKILTRPINVLENQADSTLVHEMRARCQTQLDELLSCNYRNRGGLHRQILSLLVTELNAIKEPQSFTVSPLFSHLLVSELIKIRYYTWGNWAVGPRRVCCRQSLSLIKIMFGGGLNDITLESHRRFFATEDPACFEGQISPLGLELLRYFWRHDFTSEMALVEQHRKLENRRRQQLPDNTVNYLATVVKPGYTGMLNGNLSARQTVVALNEFFLENFRLEDDRPYRKDNGGAVSLEDFEDYAILHRDTELLHVIFTELLQLYLKASQRQRREYLAGGPIAFNGKKLLRKMTKNPTTYNLEAKLRLCADLYYGLQVVDASDNSVSLTKLLHVEHYDDDLFTLKAQALFALIAATANSSVGLKSKKPAYVYYLPIGGKKGSQHVKIIIEHIIAMLKHGDRAYAGQTKKLELNLWQIINNYRQIITSYHEYADARSKNVWLKRLTQGLYKAVADYVAPHFAEFRITPEIINPKSGKAVNIPTSTTIKTHKIMITHKGGL